MTTKHPTYVPTPDSGRLLRTLLILAGVFFVMIIIAGSLGAWLSGFMEPATRGCYLMQSAVQALVAFVGTAVITARLTSGHPWKFLGMACPCTVRHLIGVIIVFLIGFPFINQIIYYNSLLHLPDCMAGIELWMVEMEEVNAEVTRKVLSGSSVADLISGVLVVGVLTGLGEELLFRGTLQQAMTRDTRLGVWSIWITVAVFSAVHLQFFGFFPRLLLGAFFGYLIYFTRSIWPGVFAHALNNSIVVASAWRSPGMLAGNVTDTVAGEAFSADTIGVSFDGIPWIAIASMVALALFFRYGCRYFFSRSTHRSSGNKRVHEF